MRLLATLSDLRRLGVVLDLRTGSTTTIPVQPHFIDSAVTGRVGCRPFGITWSAHELFIANNKQLLVFDKHLEYQRTEATPLQVNTHQLAYHAGRVWAVSPWTNSLIGINPGSPDPAVEFDLLNQKLQAYVAREALESDDKKHFNSLLWAHGSLFVAAHNFGNPSFIVRYHESTMQFESLQYDVGLSIHGLAWHQEDLFWISTQTNEILSSSGFVLPLARQGYARGLAMTDDYFIVAISEFRSRSERSGGDSWVHLIDRRRCSLVGEIHLPDTGSINDLRLLDEYDYAHRLQPFWSAEGHIL